MSENRDEVATKQSTNPVSPFSWKKSSQSRAADIGTRATASTVVMRTSQMVRFLKGREKGMGRGGVGRGKESGYSGRGAFKRGIYPLG